MNNDRQQLNQTRSNSAASRYIHASRRPLLSLLTLCCTPIHHPAPLLQWSIGRGLGSSTRGLPVLDRLQTASRLKWIVDSPPGCISNSLRESWPELLSRLWRLQPSFHMRMTPPVLYDHRRHHITSGGALLAGQTAENDHVNSHAIPC